MARSTPFDHVSFASKQLSNCSISVILGLTACSGASMDQSISKEIQTYNYGILFPGAPKESNSLDVYLCDKSTSSRCPTLVYIHGGGLLRGNKDNIGYVAEYFNRQGMCFASVGYPVYNKIFRGLIDQQIASVAQASEWLTANLELRTDRCTMNGSTLMGHSAGAYLASVLATSPRHEKAVKDYTKYVFNDSAWYDPAGIFVSHESKSDFFENKEIRSPNSQRNASQLQIPPRWSRQRQRSRDHEKSTISSGRRIAGFEIALGVSRPYSTEERKRIESISPLYLASTRCDFFHNKARSALILSNEQRDQNDFEVITQFASGLERCKRFNVTVERHNFSHDQMKLEVANPASSVGASVKLFLNGTI